MLGGLFGAGVKDEPKEPTVEEIFKGLQKDQKPKIDIGKALVGGICGALIAVLICALCFQKAADVEYSTILWGFFIGIFGGFLATALALYIEATGKDKFMKENDLRREAIRRQEMEKVETHDEYVYYDAGREHSCLFRLLCCPYYGKITSERIIYSAQPEPGKDLTSDSFCKRFCGCWEKKIDQVDYDTVVDAGVEQSCTQYLTDTGTVIIYCCATADVSIITEQHEKLINAINMRDEAALKKAIHSSSIIPELKSLVHQAENLVAQLVHERKAQCLKEGKPFVPLYVNNDNKDNAQVIRVLDVSRPYAVLDDLSYKISKAHKVGSLKERVINFLNFSESGYIEAPEGISAEELVEPLPRCQIFSCGHGEEKALSGATAGCCSLACPCSLPESGCSCGVPSGCSACSSSNTIAIKESGPENV